MHIYTSVNLLGLPTGISSQASGVPTASTSSTSSKPNYFGGTAAGVSSASSSIFDDKSKSGYTGTMIGK